MAKPGIACKLPASWLTLWLSVGVMAAICVPVESERIRAIGEDTGWLSSLFNWNIDTTPYLILLLTLPIFWCWPGRACRTQPLCRPERVGWADVMILLVVAASSLLVNVWISSWPVGRGELSFGSLPPAYHDEYSYLFQARTFLSGHLAFDSHPTMPELFDQMHVINEGRVASRYFPATGMWMAPFVAWGHPFWSMYVARALSCILVALTARELAGRTASLFAGLAFALAPGNALFGNLLLAHQPAQLGLALYSYSLLVFLRNQKALWGIAAGSGLAFAMLARPMTAAGFALPGGILLLWLKFQPRKQSADASGTSESPARFQGHLGWRQLGCVGIPIVCGLMALLPINLATTGRLLETPYQLYTNTYTPRHVYGFNNVRRGERNLGPRVIVGYDTWAQNLDVPLARENVRRRWIAGWQWALGIVPLAVVSVLFWPLLPGNDRRWWLVPASILALHAAHIPYWFTGILDHHYVFEAVLGWSLMIGGVTAANFIWFRSRGRSGLAVWWGLVLLAAIIPSYLSADSFWSESRMNQAVQTTAFSRIEYDRFQKLVKQIVWSGQEPDPNHPALILVRHDPLDQHFDLIDNPPRLQGPLLLGRLRDGQTDLMRVQDEFPERRLFLYDVKSRRLVAWNNNDQSSGGLGPGT